MSELSQPAAGASDFTNPPVSQESKKRGRIRLSCTMCRYKKLKCDRNEPCDNCIKRGQAACCTYSPPDSDSRLSHTQIPSSRASMQSRIRHLESLVITMMSKTTQREPKQLQVPIATESSPNSSSNKGLGDGIEDSYMSGSNQGSENGASGRILLEETQTTYVPNAHWEAILDDITEVREYFQEKDKGHKQQLGDVKSPANNGPLFLYSVLKPLNKNEVLATLPPRGIVDRLIWRYFNSKDPACAIIHTPTFQKEYEQFWAAPQDTPIMWIGLTFAMMALSIFFYRRCGDELPEPLRGLEDPMFLYRTRTAQCMVLANYARPTAYTLETLILHGQAEYVSQNDDSGSVCMTIGILVRLATRMGYHRDAKHYKNITAFHGEMRRRVWSFICQTDLFVSFQFGLPSLTRGLSKVTDAAEPSNLLDEDFDENSTKLPLPRPKSEMTPVSYEIAKAAISTVFGRIVELDQLLTPTPYDEIIRLDADLRNAHAAMPLFLCMRPLIQSIADPTYLILQRYTLEIFYQTSLCVLHRKYIAEGRSNLRYAYSRKSCADAAMEVLKHQSSIYFETQPGGQLYRDKWFVSSLRSSDFLLAAMIVCLELYYEKGYPMQQQTTGHGQWDLHRKPEDLLQALEASYAIWNDSRTQSVDSYKACEILAIILGKVKASSSSSDMMTKAGNSATGTSNTLSLGSSGSFLSHQDTPLKTTTSPPPYSLTNSDNATSNNLNLDQPFHLNDSNTLPSDFLSFIDDIPSTPAELEWSIWDAHFQDSDAIVSESSWPTDSVFMGADSLYDPMGLE